MVMSWIMFAIKEIADLERTIQKGWETLPMQQRIDEARERLPKKGYVALLIDKMKESGREDYARDLSIIYDSARAVADMPKLDLDLVSLNP